jgi:membrane associated rhomboid family serine protease
MFPVRDHNPSHRTPWVSYTVIGLCVLVFFWQVSLGPAAGQRAVFSLGAIPAVLFGHAELAPELAVVPAWATLVTSMFMHGGLAHIASNLLYLWVFGDNVEDSMGHARFALFYLGGGVAAALAHAALEPGSEIPMIGASGAISAVLGAYLVLFPHAQVTLFVPFGLLFVPVKAGWLLVIWFAMQVFNLFGTTAGGGVAWGAHIGGFVAGALLVMPLRDRSVPLFGGARRRGPWG